MTKKVQVQVDNLDLEQIFKRQQNVEDNQPMLKHSVVLQQTRDNTILILVLVLVMICLIVMAFSAYAVETDPLLWRWLGSFTFFIYRNIIQLWWVDIILIISVLVTMAILIQRCIYWSKFYLFYRKRLQKIDNKDRIS